MIAGYAMLRNMADEWVAPTTLGRSRGEVPGSQQVVGELKGISCNRQRRRVCVVDALQGVNGWINAKASQTRIDWI